MITNVKLTKSKIFFFLLSFLLILFLMMLLSRDYQIVLNGTIILNFLSIVLSLLIITLDERLISINKIYGYFMLIFMGFAPLFNFCANYYPWNYFIEEKYLTLGHLMVIAWNIIYIFFYYLFNHSPRKQKKHKREYKDDNLLPLFVLASIFVFIYAIGTIGLQNLLTRNENSISTGGSFDIVIDFIIRFVPVITLFFLIMKRKYNVITIFQIIICSLITFILNYPVSNSRFNTAAVGLSLVCAIIFKNYNKIKNKNSRIMDWILLFSVLIIFPLFSYFKENTLSDLIQNGFTIDITSSFNSVDFDAFTFVSRGIKYVDIYGFTYGKQILSSIFFFVPRSILPIKGVPSGELIVSAQAPGTYNNVSCPFITELYLDFGVLGLIFGPILLAFIFSKFDFIKDQILIKNSENNYFLSLYSLLFSYQIYMLRGALAPTFLRFMGSILPIILFFLFNLLLSKFDFRILSKHSSSLQIRRQ